MSTYTAKPSDITKKWVIIDATNLVVGRLASLVALRLRGKHLPTYTPHMDMGDNVIIINAEKVKLTGNKPDQRKFYWHIGHPGCTKDRTQRQLLDGHFAERVVENAVRHGLEAKAMSGRLTIIAEDFGADVVITVEDDGVGEDPERVRRALAGDPTVDSVGLGNVDERLRSTFGPQYGLVVDTAIGAGTKVTLRVPKFAPGVHPDE